MTTRLTLMLIIAVFVAGGCSSSRAVSFSHWEKELDQKAAHENGGDMGFLRYSDNANVAYPQFAILGSKSADDSHDVVGIFLGRHTLASTNWLVFLVASTKKLAVDDIRIALRSDDGGRPRWVMSDEDSNTQRAYTAYRESLWRNRHPDRDKPPRAPSAFPHEQDVFTIEVFDQTVTVREERSGARWLLRLDRKRSERH